MKTKVDKIKDNLKSRRWTKEEEEIITRNIIHTTGHIQKLLQLAGFPRTKMAVEIRINRMRARLDRSAYSAAELALLIGVTKPTVSNWIRQGWLYARRRPDDRTPQQGGHTFIIYPNDVKRFVQEHPMVFDLAKVDQVWFMDLMFDGNIGATVRRRPLKLAPTQADEEMEAVA